MGDIVVRRLHTLRLRITLYVLLAAAWGLLVDRNLIPILAPNGNSTIVQASTAAAFAILGILFGPIPGALGGLIRDGSGHVLLLLLHPNLAMVEALGRAIPDILEDVMLGLIPGLVGLSTRRLLSLVTATAAAAWISLPFLEVGNVLVAGRPRSIRTVLTTAPGNWNQPVDPGLTVYALLAAGMAAIVLTRYASNPLRTFAIGIILLAAGCMMIVLGAHA